VTPYATPEEARTESLPARRTRSRGSGAGPAIAVRLRELTPDELRRACESARREGWRHDRRSRVRCAGLPVRGGADEMRFSIRDFSFGEFTSAVARRRTRSHSMRVRSEATMMSAAASNRRSRQPRPRPEARRATRWIPRTRSPRAAFFVQEPCGAVLPPRRGQGSYRLASPAGDRV